MDKHLGLLVVHGIGEQKRFETTRQLARSILAGLEARGAGARFSLIDRASTPESMPMNCPRVDLDGSPFMIACATKGSNSTIYVHLHEVWWADLGAPATLGEQIRFWLWGLGQWGAQVIWKSHFKENPSNTDLFMEPPTKYCDVKDKIPSAKPRPFARAMLFLSGFLALLTLFSWEAVKRAFSWLSPVAGSPAILTSYIGDVRIYTQGPGKGGGNITDIGQPWRATIRRRMVSQMVAMAERDYNRWYILGHSLGSVLAFNGVQETEWNLPNYLDPAQVERLKQDQADNRDPKKVTLWTSETPDAGDPEPDLGRMMPRRPVWLDKNDRISRRALFAKFGGLVTYGSPLDKFAALWPRIVPINKQRDVFPTDADWINLSDATDPVGANITAFEEGWSIGTAPASSPLNIRVKASAFFLLAHIRYFLAPSPSKDDHPETRALVNLLFPQDGKTPRLSEAFARAGNQYGNRAARVMLAIAWVIGLALTLIAGTSLLALVLKSLGDTFFKKLTASLSGNWPDWTWLHSLRLCPNLPERTWHRFTGLLKILPVEGFAGTMLTTLCLAWLVVFVAGWWRRYTEI
ncbi:hypothetical protein GCM10009087_18640 [Sphingomonas oligophenolica]|uniref:Alpha/beta hydrolase n=1 Tax=Sphingomonas oligophenolica TaxID=301154 RepID=A0ABU9Y3D4_9SPHN